LLEKFNFVVTLVFLRCAIYSTYLHLDMSFDMDSQWELSLKHLKRNICVRKDQTSLISSN